MQWKIGDVTVAPLVELEWRFSPEMWLPMLMGSSVEAARSRSWLRSDFLTAADEFPGSVQTFLLETPSRRIVVDTGFGNSKTRSAPVGRQLQTDFLDRMTLAGWPPDAVDMVICTHLHSDHVGWNTQLVDGLWVPTFRNAEYYFVEAECDHWCRYAQSPSMQGAYSEWARSAIDGEAVYNDSVRPVLDAGLARMVSAGASITPDISFLPSSGHTPHHTCVTIESQGDRGVITGDMLHFPVQIAFPAWSTPLDSDPTEAANTRRTLLARWADTDTLVMGTHFPPPTAGHIVRDGDGFRFA